MSKILIEGNVTKKKKAQGSMLVSLFVPAAAVTSESGACLTMFWDGRNKDRLGVWENKRQEELVRKRERERERKEERLREAGKE